MKNFSSMIDSQFEVINDMGTAPIVAAMIEVLGIPETVNRFVGATDPRIKVDTGTAIKALIINMLYGRVPLVHVEESFKQVDCEVLFGSGLIATDFCDDCLGRGLEDVGNADIRKLYSEVCMHALNIHGALAEEIHVDTTNISLYGDYNNTSAKDFEVAFGDPKSRLKDLKQLNIGLYVQQNGLPIGGNALSGNKSDVVWFREALEELNILFSGDINTMPICIFDAAGSNEEMYKKANNLSVPTIIRQSDRFKMTGEYISKAWEEEKWTVVDKNGNILETEPTTDVYKMRTFDILVDTYEWRLIVVYSSELKKLKESTAKRNFPKQKEILEKEAKKLFKIGFETLEAANQAGNTFIKKNIGLKAPFKYEINIEKSENKKYSKSGKPSKTSTTIASVEYRVKFAIGERDEELYAEWLRQESCFVLVSNIPKDRCRDEEVFKEYKQQWIVEEKFKFLKQPVILGPIWLQNQDRIKGLVFVLLLAVLVNMYICYRCMLTLQGKTDYSSKAKISDNKVIDESLINNSSVEKEQPLEVDENNPSLDYMRKLKNSRLKEYPNNKSQKLLTTDGRLIQKPTFITLKNLIAPLKTVTKLDASGQLVRKFAHCTRASLLELVIKIGFDPIIYLEKFTQKMDLWEY